MAGLEAACLAAAEAGSALAVARLVVQRLIPELEADSPSGLACLRAVAASFCRELPALFARGPSSELAAACTSQGWLLLKAAHSYLSDTAYVLEDPSLGVALGACQADMAALFSAPGDLQRHARLLLAVPAPALLGCLELACGDSGAEQAPRPITPTAAAAALFVLELAGKQGEGPAPGTAAPEWTARLQAAVPHTQHALTTSHRLQTLCAVFTAVTAAAQVPELAGRLLTEGDLARTTFMFLARWRFPVPVDSAFDACLAATLEAACGSLSQLGPGKQAAGPLAALFRLLSQPEAASLCFTALTTGVLWGEGQGNSAKGQGLQPAHALRALYGHEPPGLVATLAQLLNPESQQPVVSRLAALHVLEEVAVEAAEGDPGQQQGLWGQGPVHLLLYALKCDPAVRVRRAALALLTRVDVGQDGQLQAAIVETLLLKCRDRDGPTQRLAASMLLQVPPALLEAALPAPDEALLSLAYCWLNSPTAGPGKRAEPGAGLGEQAAELVARLVLSAGPGEVARQRLAALQPFRPAAAGAEALALLEEGVLARLEEQAPGEAG